MNSGEPMYSLRECCDKPIDGKERQDIIHYTLAVGLPHSIGEVRESGWREGGSGNARGSRETSAGRTELGDRW
jgi:hypothetical protein